MLDKFWEFLLMLGHVKQGYARLGQVRLG